VSLTRTITFRVTDADAERLHQYAANGGWKVASLLRHYLSTGLRTEHVPPLAQVPYRGRPKGARNRRHR